MKKIIYLIAFAALLNVANAATLQQTPFTSYKINTDSCSVIKHHTGSIIYVPSVAFTDVTGKKISGWATLEYREIRTPSDMITAAMPMLYKEGKKTFLLESSGMFEIKVTQKNLELRLGKNKKIQVKYAAPNAVENLESFIFNKSKNIWEKYKSGIMDFSYNDKPKNLKTLQSEYGRQDIKMVYAEGYMMPEDTFNKKYNDGKKAAQIIYSPENDYVGTPEERRKWDSAYNYQRQVFKVMNIDQMGMFNYDAIYHNPEAIQFTARFHLRGDTSELTSTVYLVYDKLNTVISNNNYTWKNNFYMLPGKDYRIFSILPDGKVAVFPSNKRHELNPSDMKGKSYDFELVLAPAVVKNSQQLAAATGIR